MPYDHNARQYVPDPSAGKTDQELYEISKRYSRLNKARDRKAEGDMAKVYDSVADLAYRELAERERGDFSDEPALEKHREHRTRHVLGQVEWKAYREGQADPEPPPMSPAEQAIENFAKSDVEKARERTEWPAWGANPNNVS